MPRKAPPKMHANAIKDVDKGLMILIPSAFPGAPNRPKNPSTETVSTTDGFTATGQHQALGRLAVDPDEAGPRDSLQAKCHSEPLKLSFQSAADAMSACGRSETMGRLPHNQCGGIRAHTGKRHAMMKTLALITFTGGWIALGSPASRHRPEWPMGYGRLRLQQGFCQERRCDFLSARFRRVRRRLHHGRRQGPRANADLYHQDAKGGRQRHPFPRRMRERRHGIEYSVQRKGDRRQYHRANFSGNAGRTQHPLFALPDVTTAGARVGVRDRRAGSTTAGRPPDRWSIRG